MTNINYPVPENSYLRDCIESEIIELPDLISWCSIGQFKSIINLNFNSLSTIDIQVPLGRDMWYVYTKDTNGNTLQNDAPYQSPQDAIITFNFNFDIRDIFTADFGSGQYFITNIEFFDTTWVQRFDNTFWSTTNGIWDGTKWVSQDDGEGGWEIVLTELGSWVEGFRPTKMRMTIPI